MKAVNIVRFVVLLAGSILGSTAAFACGELQFNAGRGLPFRTYLTPNPADVLILTNDGGMEQRSFYEQLEKAGHRVVIVGDAAAMQQAMQVRRYDVVIAALESADTVRDTVETSATAATLLLPVVARGMRNSAEVRGRFAEYVLEGASLGQYLTVINKLVAGVR